MGLEISVVFPDRTSKPMFKWSYSNFHAFRVWLFNLTAKRRFAGLIKTPGKFHELLNHSDCEGVLTFAECVKLLKDFDTTEVPKSTNVFFKSRYEVFRDTVKTAVDSKGTFVFA